MHIEFARLPFSAASFAQAPPSLWDTDDTGPRFTSQGSTASWSSGESSCSVELSERVITDLGGGDARSACEALSGADGRLRFQDAGSISGEVLLPDPAAMMVVLANPTTSVKAITRYNEWVADHAAATPNRMVAVGQIPTTSIDDAKTALQQAVSLGLRAVAINALPGETETSRFPDDAREWWAAAAEHKIVVMLPPDFSTGFAPVRGVVSGGRAPDISFVVNEMPISGIFDDSPDLRVVITSGEPGWLPAALDHADNLYMRSVAIRKASLRRDDWLPSDYIRRGCWFTFSNDAFAVVNRDYIGEHHLLWSAAAPSASGRWPDDVQEALLQTLDTPLEVRTRLLSDNLRRLFRVDGSPDFRDDEIADFRTVVLL